MYLQLPLLGSEYSEINKSDATGTPKPLPPPLGIIAVEPPSQVVAPSTVGASKLSQGSPEQSVKVTVTVSLTHPPSFTSLTVTSTVPPVLAATVTIIGDAAPVPSIMPLPSVT